uniref:Protein SZT2 n=1 Tax=Syphacia muris TaxID=451379 RepID=A0A158R553_9BILA
MREAEQVLLLLHQNFRASRHVRALWLFENIGKDISINNSKHELDKSVELIGIIAKDNDPVSDDELFRICPDTVVSFLTKSYRMIFILDLSPSAFSVLIFPGLKLQFTPQLFVTICVYTPFLQFSYDSVFVQALSLDSSNVQQAIAVMQKWFEKFADSLSSFMRKSIGRYDKDRRLHSQIKQHSKVIEKHEGDFQSRREMINLVGLETAADLGYIEPQYTFCSMLRVGLLGARLLPENIQSSVILITDANIGKPNEEALQLLLSQLRNFTLSCSIIKLNHNNNSGLTCGDISNSELFHFLASSTFGAYLDDNPALFEKTSFFGMNTYQKALLSWSFQKPLLTNPFLEQTFTQFNPEFMFFLKRDIRRQNYVTLEYETSLERILILRMREGYVIRKSFFKKIADQLCLLIELTLPWRSMTFINYCIQIPWPADLQRVKMEVTFGLETSSNELDKIQSEIVTIPSSNEIYADALGISFNSFIQADHYVAYLHSFNDDPNLFTIPKEIETGEAVFQLNSFNLNESGLVLSKSLENPFKKKASVASFVKYWQPFCNFSDGTCDDITLPPKYYYMIRITLDPPCVCLKIAFLCGTPAEIRAQKVAEITRDLMSVTVSRILNPNSNQCIDSANNFKATEIPSVTLINRPLERILALYRKVPSSLNSLIRLDTTGNKRETILQNAIVKYLSCSRRLHHLSRIHPQIYTKERSADYILRTILLRRIEEGFSITGSCNGIVTFCKETKAENDEYYGSALQQYILFPPFPLITNGSSCTIGKPGDAFLREVPEHDKDYVVATELWMEPLGTIDKELTKMANQKNKTINVTDQRIIETLSTFDQLMTLSEAFREKHEIFLSQSLINTKSQVTQYNSKISSISSSFSLKALLENSGESKVIFLPTLTFDDDTYSSMQRVQVLLECLHEQFLAVNSCCMEICDVDTWQYFSETVLSAGRIQFSDDGQKKEKIKEKFHFLLRSPKTPILLYISHISPWHLVLTLVPTSPKHVINMKQGETLSIPLVISLCDEPWIASNLARLQPEEPIRKISDAGVKFAVSPLADLHAKTRDTELSEQYRKVDFHWISTARAPLEYINASGCEYVSCSIRDYCSYIEDRLFSRAFTKSVYRAVNEGIKIARADVNAVIDIHSEQEALEIDDFNHCFGFLCSHVAEFRQKCGNFGKGCFNKECLSEFSRDGITCEEEHKAFKTLFSKITGRNFSLVPAFDNFLFYKDSSVTETSQLLTLCSDDENKFSSDFDTHRSSYMKDPDCCSFCGSEPDAVDFSAMYSPIRLRNYKYSFEAPLFIKFECIVKVSEDDFVTFPVSYIPSCILKVLKSNMNVFENVALDDTFEISLHVTVVTWPRLDYVFDNSTYPWLRNGRKSSIKPKKYFGFEDGGVAMPDDEQELPGVLDGLSVLEKEALELLQRKIYRLVEFETVLAMSRYESPEREDLVKIVSFIADQIELGEETTHFKTMKLKLSFVSNHERAFWRLRKRMETLVLDYCCLYQAADPVASSTTFPLYYYCCCVKDKELFRERYLELLNNSGKVPCEGFQDIHSSSLNMTNIPSVVKSEEPRGKSSVSENQKPFGNFDEVVDSRKNTAEDSTVFCESEAKKSAVDNSHIVAAQDSSVDELTKCELFDFWLILALDPFTATISFCQRYDNLHENIFSLLCNSLKSGWRIINQKTLLENMFQTRLCDVLLVPKDEDVLKIGRDDLDSFIETRSFTSSLSSTWSKKVWEIYSEGGTVPLPIVKCTPGQFTCEIVNHYWFFVHPRLRENCVAVYEDPLSSALEVLKTRVKDWAVKNRTNMYVFKENEDLFYLRIHTDASTVYETSGEPNNLWMTKMNKDFEKNILLTVHGYCFPGGAVEEVVQEMQKCLMRRTMEDLKESIQIGKTLNLYPEDVEYLQSNPSTPERIFHFTLPRVTENFLGTIFYYLCQQLSMYAVPIADSYSSGFQPYYSSAHPVFDEKKIFYAINHKAGLGCIQLRFVQPDGMVKTSLDYARFDKDAFSQLSPVWTMSQIGLKAFLSRISSLPVQESGHDKHYPKADFCTLAQFVLWVEGGTEQSLVPIQSICRLVVNQFGLFGKPILEFNVFQNSGPAPIRLHDERKSDDVIGRRPSGETTISLLSTSRTSFTNVRSCMSNPRISTASSRSQLSQPDVTGKPLLNPLVRRLSQNSAVYEPPLEEFLSKYEKLSQVYVTTRFNAIAADWFDHVLAELKSKKEEQYSLKKHSFRMDSDYAARKILQEVERRLAAALPTESIIVFIADSKGSKRLASVGNIEDIFKRVDLDVGRVQSNDRKITAGGPEEPKNTKMALIAYNQEFDEAVLDFGADISKNEEASKKLLESEQNNSIFRFSYSIQPFVPRRRLLYMVFSGDECDLYVYNYSATKAEEVYKIVATAAFWLNGRSYLIREICLDKMGITHLHQNFQLVMDPSLINERRASGNCRDVKGFCNTDYEKAFLWLNAKALTKYSFPDEDDPLFRRMFRVHCDSALEAQLRMKLYTYFRCPNSYLLMLKFYKEQCRQMVDILLRTYDRFDKLYRALRSGCAELPETELFEMVDRSREIYFERAPLLFYPKWRPSLPSVHIAARGTVELPGPPKSADFSKISQHSFFSSVPSFVASKPPTPTSSKLNNPPQFQKPSCAVHYSSAFEPVSCLLRENADPFVVKLEFMFIEEYVKYLKDLGLQWLKVTNICNRSKEFNYYTLNYNAEITRRSPNVWLCKALDAGVLFLNLTFSKLHFSVRVLFWNESQQSHSVMGSTLCSIDKKKQRNAGMEKDLIVALLHVQSFTYDFHLRTVEKYLIGGIDVLFDPGYDTHSLLSNFMLCFKGRSARSRNALMGGTLEITDLSVDEGLLWNYLLSCDDKLLRVVPLRTGSDTPIQYMLAWEEQKELFHLPYKYVNLCVRDNLGKAGNGLRLRIYAIIVSSSKNVSRSNVARRDLADLCASAEFRQKICVQKTRLYKHHAGTEIESLTKTFTNTCKVHDSLVKQSVVLLKRTSLQRSPLHRSISARKRSMRRLQSDAKQQILIPRKNFFRHVASNTSLSSKHLRLGHSILYLDERDQLLPFKEDGIFVNYICLKERALQMQLEKSYALFKRRLVRFIKDGSSQCRLNKLWMDMLSPAWSTTSVSSTEKGQNAKNIYQLSAELKQVYSSAVSIDDINELLSCTLAVPLSDFNENFGPLSRDFIPDSFFRAVIRNYGCEKCRFFCTDIEKHLVMAADKQTVFLFSVVGKQPLEIRLVHKKIDDASRIIQNGVLIDPLLNSHMNEILHLVASFCWLELAGSPLTGRFR